MYPWEVNGKLLQMFERRDKLGESKGSEALGQVRVHFQPSQGLVAFSGDHSNTILYFFVKISILES